MIAQAIAQYRTACREDARLAGCGLPANGNEDRAREALFDAIRVALQASEERARRAEQATGPLIFALRQIEIRAAAGAPAVEASATLSWISRAARIALRAAPPPAATETPTETDHE